jgi:aminoglycoside 2''-phosphotransferase
MEVIDEYEVSKGAPIDIALAREFIGLAEPPIEVNEIEFIGHGMASCAYRVNGSLVFRIAKNRQAEKSLRKECLFLPYLRHHLDLHGCTAIEIPRIAHIAASDSGSPCSGVGYASIEGMFLSGVSWTELTAEEKRTLVYDFAQFLKALHSVPIERGKDCGLDIEQPLTFYEHYRKFFTEELAAGFSNGELEVLESIFSRLRSYLTNNPPQLCVAHGDISPDHILIDPHSKRLKGVIDFGDLKIADSDWDLIYMEEDFEEEFFDMLLSYKVTSTPKNELLWKLNVYRMCLMSIFIQEGLAQSNSIKTNMGWRFVRQQLQDLQ